jgi:CBS-domain-containing membrane protein
MPTQQKVPPFEQPGYLPAALRSPHQRQSQIVQEKASLWSPLKWTIVKKMRGDGVPLPPRPSFQTIALAWLGGCLAIALIAGLADFLATSLVLGSFGASCVLVFGFPDVPFSQPRNVLIGHLLSSLVGLTFLTLCGPQWWAVALAVGTAIAVMMGTRTVHPPAGSNPVIVFLMKPDWHFLLYPTCAGALLLVAVALVYNNVTRTAKYPKYW